MKTNVARWVWKLALSIALLPIFVLPSDAEARRRGDEALFSSDPKTLLELSAELG